MLAETVVLFVAAVTVASLWLADCAARLVFKPDPADLPQEVTDRIEELRKQRLTFELQSLGYRREGCGLLADRSDRDAARGREIDRLVNGGRR